MTNFGFLSDITEYALFAQAAIEAFEVDDLAPSQFLDQGNTVEDKSIHIVYGFPRGIRVGHELHRVHQGERLALQRVGEVGVGDDEERVGDVVPYAAGLDYALYVAELR